VGRGWSKITTIFVSFWEVSPYDLVDISFSFFFVTFIRENLKEGSIYSPQIEVFPLENFFFFCVTKHTFSSRVLEIFTKLHGIGFQRAQTV
jgi:hypothetical protein